MSGSLSVVTLPRSTIYTPEQSHDQAIANAVVVVHPVMAAGVQSVTFSSRETVGIYGG